MPREQIAAQVNSNEIVTLRVSWGEATAPLVRVGSELYFDDQEVEGGVLLNRAQVNHMIRTLRKARDRMFGSDA